MNASILYGKKSSATNFDGKWFLIRIGTCSFESQGTCVSYVAKFLDPQVQLVSVLCQNFSASGVGAI